MAQQSQDQHSVRLQAERTFLSVSGGWVDIMRVRLAIKYTVISSVVLLLVMSGSAFLHITKVQGVFLEEAKVDTDVLLEMILRDTYHMMLENDRNQLQMTMVETARAPRISRIRILGKEGVISFSSMPNEIGTRLPETADSCVFCHVEGSKALLDAPIESRSRTFSDDHGHQYLNVTRAIYNEPNCSNAACHFHSPQDKKIGVLDVAVSLEPMVQLAHSHHKDVIVSTFVMLLILSLCHYLLTRVYICNPIQGILEQTQALSQGDLMARIKKPGNDEIGRLGHSFNEMADNLAQAQSELKEWGSTLEHKVEERTEEIHAMQDQLLRSAKLASMGELVAGIAHEINNPLTGILMFASLSSKSKDLPDQVKENLDIIVSETNRCAKIVRGLLEFARESIPEKKPEAINRVIKHSLDLVSQQAIFQNINVECYLDADLPELSIDADQFQQVFFNMFINAGQAMVHGGTLTIKTSLNQGGRSVCVQIRDTGLGVSKENIGSIFDPFFSTKSDKGFGLGLSVTYGIIRNHGGRIDVKSEEGQWTHFTICLPVKEGDILYDKES